MIAAAPLPRQLGHAKPLLVIHPENSLPAAHKRLSDLPQLLRKGDVLVVNDAATLPAALQAQTSEGAWLELRLMHTGHGSELVAAVFGEGDWRTDTNQRTPATLPEVGSRLRLRGCGELEVVGVGNEPFPHVRLNTERAQRAAFCGGSPVQYSYLERGLDRKEVQTTFAGRPWASEMPSAAEGLTAEILYRLRQKGVEVGALTHGAGLSALGSEAADAHLPMPERFAIPQRTLELVRRAKAGSGRVIAVGTTVVRALENHARLPASQLSRDPHSQEILGVATLTLGPDTQLRVVDGVLSGIHEPGTSHHSLLQAFAPLDVLQAAHVVAVEKGYLAHEFGDHSLVLPAQLAPLTCCVGLWGVGDGQPVLGFNISNLIMGIQNCNIAS